MSKFYDFLTEEALMSDNNVRLLCSVVGVDATKKLMQEYGGITLYIPTGKKLIGDYLDSFLEQNPNTNNKEIAIELRLSESYIQKLKNKLLQKRQSGANYLD